MESLSLEEIIKRAEGGVFNNAAQVWNHTFYWESLKPGGSKPTAAIEKLLAQNFGSFDVFKEKFSAAAVKTFGSGWAWLITGRACERAQRDGRSSLAPSSPIVTASPS